MKNYTDAMIIIALTVTMVSGCGTTVGSAHSNKTNNVDAVIKQQMASETVSLESSESVEPSEDADISSNTTTQKPVSDDEVREKIIAEQPDIDLTVMGADMVYATVYQMMVNPDEYVGKTIKMNGTYYNSYYEPNDTYYNYCIIKDALACCSQGLEFEKSSDISIEENAEITVTGVFETYKEDGNLYCHIVNSKIE